MAKTWTPELQSILHQGVFEECNISISKALCEKIAARIRAANIEGFTECTPKAVENQLYKFKKKSTAAAAASPAAGAGAAGAAPSNPGSPSVSKKAAPKTPKTPKTPRAKKAVKKATAPEPEEGDEEELVSPSPTKGRKRGAKGEGKGEGGAKKVKTEPATPESDCFSAGQAEEEV
ncbi:hypothetical protein B5807_11529 [Epicoccum nigrum]|uniref:Uncharacterized protein n=1 Tax=Epicoccum nigrum TaxID=105696 RepID=A0A1Y2LIG0_EPING|nr:hypothetical protein B5807_11529 [Epicoccum nigrum]